MNIRTNPTRLHAAAIGLVAILAAGGSALAADIGKGETDQAEMKKVMSATVTLTDAIAKAEQAVGGHAFDATISDEKGDNAWEIELANADGTVKTVMVDIKTGKVDQNASDEKEAEHGEQGEDAEDGEVAD
ncbi:PepSY domain-containing protein [Aurantimonas litoralis]|nr:PepSY domain-containing protein [Aurantimonas litoralis]